MAHIFVIKLCSNAELDNSLRWSSVPQETIPSSFPSRQTRGISELHGLLLTTDSRTLATWSADWLWRGMLTSFPKSKRRNYMMKRNHSHLISSKNVEVYMPYISTHCVPKFSLYIKGCYYFKLFPVLGSVHTASAMHIWRMFQESSQHIYQTYP